MKSKKALSGLLILGLTLSSNVPTFANSQVVAGGESRFVAVDTKESSNDIKNPLISEKKAMSLAKEYIKEFFEIDINENEFQVNIQNRDTRGVYSLESNVWYISFYQYNRDNNISIDVSIHGDNGKLLSINRWEYNRLGENKVSRFTKEEARKKAEEFLNNRHKDLLDQLKLEENSAYDYMPEGGLGATNYMFSFRRHKDGIPVLSDGVVIGIDSGTGNLSTYSFTWTDEKLPEKGEIISKDKAQKIIEDSLDVRLNYIPVRNINSPYYNDIKEIKLAYSTLYENGGQVDAVTGKFVNNYQLSNDKLLKKDITEEEKREIRKLAENQDVKEITTKEAAKKKAEEILSKVYDEKIKITNINYNSNSRMSSKAYKTWEVQFSFEENYRTEGYISLDADTGRVLNLSNYNYLVRDLALSGKQDFKPQITWEKAYDKAIDVLKNLYPKMINSVATEQTYRESYYSYNDYEFKDIEYYFGFNRLENGVIFNNNHLTISIDTSTGRVQNIYVNWDDIELPTLDRTMSKEEAKDIFCKELDIKLAYSYIYPQEPGSKEKPEIKLVYSNMPNGNAAQFNLLDAKTGTFINWNGQEKESLDSKKDIMEQLKDHWAYKELSIMAERNIINLQEVSLTDKVTREQLIKMLTIAKRNIYYGEQELQELKFTDVDKDDPDYRYLQLAVEYGLIDNKVEALEGDKYITREELAQMLIKAVNLDKVASIKDIYSIPVADIENISEDRLGHVALAYGLGIIKGRGENYLPKEEVDVTQVAVSIYRIMEAMGGSFR